MNDIQIKCNLWFESMLVYFEKYPKAFEHFKELITYDQLRLHLAIDSISQINRGKGFSIENLLEGINVDGFYSFLYILELCYIKRKSYYKFLHDKYIIDEFQVENSKNEICLIYNRIDTKIYNNKRKSNR